MFNITALQEMYAWLNNEYVLDGAIYDFLGLETNYFLTARLFVIELRNFPSISLLVQVICSKTKCQIKQNADWRIVDSTEKQTNEFVCFLP